MCGFMPAAPQGTQRGRRKGSGHEIEMIHADAEYRSSRDDAQTRPDQLDANRQRLPGHLSSDIAAAHPTVTENHDGHGDDRKHDDPSGPDRPLPKNVEYQHHESNENCSNAGP